MPLELRQLPRCPHCGTAKAGLEQLWHSKHIRSRPGTAIGRYWAALMCTTCNDLVLICSLPCDEHGISQVQRLFPEPDAIDRDLPTRVATYLQQAIDSRHSPDGAAMLAGAAVDAMLKEKGLDQGTLYNRIDQAVEQNILTKDMGEWAHSVRLGSNRPRHADLDHPHVSKDEAEQAIEFTRTLGHVLFILPARVARGRAAVSPASSS